MGSNISRSFWNGKKVFLTGHTGFKGSWLSVLLCNLGAELYGYSLAPLSPKSMYELCQIESILHNTELSDIRDRNSLIKAVTRFKPDIVIHMAAQSLVRNSYIDPVGTYETNVMGTVNLLEACKKVSSIKSIIVVTTDKCYENTEQIWPYREFDRLGGFDPYSNSKACCELVVEAYRNSFFPLQEGIGLATARAGNVIGGGDWSNDRLIPDFVRASYENKKLVIRNPGAIRPWQHVLDPLNGYLLLAENLYEGVNLQLFSGAWNFGPSESSNASVSDVLNLLSLQNPRQVEWTSSLGDEPHEANALKLDATKARKYLGWNSRLNLHAAIKETINWYNQSYSNPELSLKVTSEQIQSYMRIDHDYK